MGLIKKGKETEELKSELADILEITVSPKDGTITDRNGVTYTLSALMPELKPSLFTNGKSYRVEILKGKGGMLYIQKIIGEMTEKVAPKSEPKFADKPTMTKQDYWREVKKTYDEWDKEGPEIGWRGFIQSSAIAASNFSLNAEELEKNMRLVLTVMDKLLVERNG